MQRLFITIRGIVFTENTPRIVIKAAFSAGMMQDGAVFIDMMLSRNALAHCYDYEKFKTVLSDTKVRYLDALEDLHSFFTERMI